VSRKIWQPWFHPVNPTFGGALGFLALLAVNGFGRIDDARAGAHGDVVGIQAAVDVKTFVKASSKLLSKISSKLLSKISSKLLSKISSKLLSKISSKLLFKN
jgi:hypothetical protein